MAALIGLQGRMLLLRRNSSKVSEMMTVSVFELVGENAVSMDSGKLVYDRIHAPLKQGDVVVLDFSGVEIFATPFFNASVGFLLNDMELTQLLANLRIEGISVVGKQLLNHVIANALTFYKK